MNLGGTVHINKKGFVVLLCLSLLLIYYLVSNKGRHEASSQVNLRRLLAVAIKAAENGGTQVIASRDHLTIESKGKTKEGANDSVTTADLKSHCVMLHTLHSVFPTLQIISEESQTVCSQDEQGLPSQPLDSKLPDEWVHGDDITVWIDPLDATQEYTEKLYEYVTTMVCVAVNGKPIIGVIHKPFTKSTSWAWNGKGSSFNNNPKPHESTDLIKFIVSRSHMGKVKELLKESYKNKKIEIKPAGGAGYKVLEVVNGNADAYVHLTAIKKWDICAGNAILNALGGRMVTKDKVVIDYADSQNPLNENGLIATLQNLEIDIKV